MNRTRASLLLLTLALAACDSQHTPAPGQAASNEVPAPSAMAEPTEPVAAKIIKWGPEKVPAGKTFNVQADGNSGIWFELETPVPAGTLVTGTFDGKPLIGPVVNGKFGAATIPLDYLAKPGTYAMELSIPKGSDPVPAGKIIVE